MASNLTVLLKSGDLPVAGLLPPVVLQVVMGLCAVVNEALGILGIVANIVNILVFYRQGYDDSVNITLTALAVSDIGSLLTLQIFNIMINPWFMTLDIDVYVITFVELVSFYPHNYFIRVCGFITAFASFERCLCVVVPLKVKQIITKRVSIATNIFIFLFLCLNLVPIYYVTYLGWTFMPIFNKTILIGMNKMDPYIVFGISYYFTDLFIPYFSFFVIILCNIIIGIQLNRRALWRSSIATTSKATSESFPSKEKKLVLMLQLVAVVFIVCLIPQSAVLTTISFVPELSILGNYFDVALLCTFISNFTETITSSVNLIIYYKMSSRYRNTFHASFGGVFRAEIKAGLKSRNNYSSKSVQ
ncbi:neuropeptides capa receptor-like [Physella acuta]|uniref:neuropeptides capa receptor-like n=1 Tax=Physella acuta TaxID=109671 RepID=UPI0027DDF3A1|nr:neuropeptides capa receptor-like [Physella acuta]